MEHSITVADGKYTVIHDDGTNFRALRYGEPWRDLTGDGLILALVQRIEDDMTRSEIEDKIEEAKRKSYQAYDNLLIAENEVVRLESLLAKMQIPVDMQEDAVVI